MVMAAAILLMVLTMKMDEDDDDNDDVEHDVKDDLIVDSHRRLEPAQHHEQYHRCHSKKQDKQQHIRTSRTADAGRTTIVDAVVDMSCGGEDQNKCS